MTKTWDEFVARQVEATLKGESVEWGAKYSTHHWRPSDIRWYRFGPVRDGPSEYWYVSESKQIVYEFRKYS